MSFLSNLTWRYATKKYDASKSVSREDLDKVLTAINMAPTALGLQPFHVFVVTGEKKDQLIQAGKENATYLLVFCARNDLKEHTENYLNNIVAVRGGTREDVAGFEGMINSTLEKLDTESAFAWSARQAYIALGFGLAAAAELEIDSSPMEGFDPQKYSDVLGLPAHMRPVVLLALGYRADDDTFDPSRMKKVRAPKNELFEERK